MADGQQIPATALRDSLTSALVACDVALVAMTRQLAAVVADPERPTVESADLLHAHGAEAMLLARLKAEAAAARVLHDLPSRSTGSSQLAAFAVATAALGIRAALVRDGGWMLSGLAAPTWDSAVEADLATTAGSQAVAALAPWLLAGGASHPSAYALSEDHEEIRCVFRDFADGKVAPIAERIHRHDEVLPESLLAAYAEVGALGITIPEAYGGQFLDHRSMALATEELTRASLGAGGSVITRPEIAAKALLKGGSEAQKRHWLPRIASGRDIVSIAVTEPGAGSDVAALRLGARKVEGGWRLSGEKTWCTFAGRATLLLVLARTGTPAAKARGLTLFLVPKPPVLPPADDRSFAFENDGIAPDGKPCGRASGRAIPTVGYRGMHSFSVFFEDLYVPDEHRIGGEGEGFALQMAGFAGGRIQTAARAVGVMEAALRAAVAYVQERQVFGRSLGSLGLPQRRLCEMAARVALARQMTYAVCDAMDAGKGQAEASLVKLMACRDAETVTREAMQLHGGMGYSEEYAVSRYWLDARVLSIFEGAEEVLAILVIARAAVREVLAPAAP